MADLDAAKVEEIRRRLLEERAALLASSESSRGSRDPVTLDQPSVGRLSRMDALQGQAMALETERRRKTRLQRIDAALERLDEGEFGYCIAGGEPIAEKRLEFDPSAAMCLECAEAAG